MVRLVAVAISASLVGVALSACAPYQRQVEFRTPPGPRGLTCDTASGQVLTFGRATAKLYADIALKQQISDLRGHMFASGLRRIQLVQQTSECVPAPAGGVVGSLYQCTARAQMCGR
ncbi:MAG: hypothetical protein ABL904_18860 [Hyphomicrobiaceae bacterium]